IEEARPAFARIAIAGERAHAAGHRVLDHGGIHFFAGFVDDSPRGNGRDLAPILSRHPLARDAGVRADAAIFRDVRSCRQHRGGNCRHRQKGAPIHASMLSQYEPTPNFGQSIAIISHVRSTIQSLRGASSEWIDLAKAGASPFWLTAAGLIAVTV